jgi:AraC-like DNA-binding protein
MSRRADLYPEIRRLREDDGLKWREIAQRLGLALTTVHAYYNDPTGEIARARKASYGGTCAMCGGRTNGNSGRGQAPSRCGRCIRWTPDAILDAIRDWADDHGGVPPREEDTAPGGAGYARLPGSKAVAKRFGSWNAGLLAAGYGLHMDRRPETQEAIVAAVRSGERVADIAARFGVSPGTIYQRFYIRGMTIRGERP